MDNKKNLCVVEQVYRWSNLPNQTSCKYYVYNKESSWKCGNENGFSVCKSGDAKREVDNEQ